MKKIILLSFALFIIGCKTELEQDKSNLADLNLYLQTEEDIDSLMITDITQNRERHKMAFNDTIKINFKDSINDLYNIWFFKNGEMVSSPLKNSQLWLNGKNVVIKGKIDKKLIIDTILGSDLYYKSKRYNEEYLKLYKAKADSSEIDSFLIKNIQDNLDNPFSLPMASNFIRRNQNNKTKLHNLYNLILKQNNLVKKHSYFSVYNQLEKKLEIKKLNIENYMFYNDNNEIVKMEFEDDKKYLIDLWFVNCPPCIKDHKIISKKLDVLKNKNVELIGLSTDRDFSKWKNYLKTNNYNWLNFREIDSSKTISKDFGISAFPTYMLVENGGRIKVVFNSFRDIEDYLSKK